MYDHIMENSKNAIDILISAQLSEQKNILK